MGELTDEEADEEAALCCAYTGVEPTIMHSVPSMRTIPALPSTYLVRARARARARVRVKVRGR